MVAVLVVESDIRFRDGVTRQLMSLPEFKVLEAGDESEIEELIGYARPDIVVVGLSAGSKHDGLRIIKRIKLIRPELPIIVMVHGRMASLSIEAMKAGALDDIFVPFDIKELVIKIQKILGKRPKNRAKKKILEKLCGKSSKKED